MDVLFLHVPKFENHYKPIGNFSFVLFPPIGLLGLADLLVKNCYSSKIIHLGVEQHLAGSLDLAGIIHEHRPAIVGLDLHWHFQSYDVIEVARKLKQAHPEIAILLGGFTASCFAEEILRDHPFIDFVIRGDAEMPLLKLMQHFYSDRDFTDVPNLAYRNASRVLLNSVAYTADSEMLESMCFTNFALLKDYPTFVRCFSRYFRLRGMSEAFQNFLFGGHKVFQVYIGRGCIHNCYYCGGSHDAHSLLASRERVALRSASAVVSSIADLAGFGFDSACLALDPFPWAQADDYYLPIFEELIRRDITLDIEVERYFLPTRRFIEAFSRLPGKDSFITLSPHTQNAALRQRNGLHRYSNQDLEGCLDAMESAGVNSLLCFTCGLPFETKQDLEEMAGYQRRLRKKYRHMRFKTCMVEIEPGSALSRDPGHYGARLERSTFADYYRYHSRAAQNHWQEMGYSRQGCPEQREVSEFFCRHFCERFKAGRFSPVLCDLAGVLWKTRVFHVIDGAFSLKSNR